MWKIKKNSRSYPSNRHSRILYRLNSSSQRKYPVGSFKLSFALLGAAGGGFDVLKNDFERFFRKFKIPRLLIKAKTTTVGWHDQKSE